MSRKDFQLIADVIHENRKRSNAAEQWRCDEIARTFATELRSTNVRFDRVTGHVAGPSRRQRQLMPPAPRAAETCDGLARRAALLTGEGAMLVRVGPIPR